MKKGCLFERKELKYLLDSRQWENLRPEIREFMRPDDHPSYTICNLYMDTPDFRLIRRSLEKPVYKEKMRLRSYGKVREGGDVFIELKKKYKGIVYKRRVKMPLPEAMGILKGEAESSGQIEREIKFFLARYGGLSRAMFISYERTAYRGKEDPDLRLTIDRNILWRDDDLDLRSEPYGKDILDKGQLLMEIKCPGAMPLWLSGALSEQGIYKTSFSKYGKAYSRRYTSGKIQAAS